ncbi:MAG TPA: hypothetical protein DCP38_06140 [Acidobacteria bacterium]|nr:hypothetical protein [Acidobacteriota bacterium]
MRLGMFVDLDSCIGCHGCTVACKVEHATPLGIEWLRVGLWEAGEYPDSVRLSYPMRCNHCTAAPCVRVCPTGANQEREEDGIVWIDQNKCVGCRYCVIACPYQVISFHPREKSNFPSRTDLAPSEKARQRRYPLQTGTAIKCNFCKERVDEGREKGLTPGVDRAATPACVNTCQGQAMVFGDLDDTDSRVSRAIRENGGRHFHTEFSTQPSSYVATRRHTPVRAVDRTMGTRYPSDRFSPDKWMILPTAQREWAHRSGLWLVLALFFGGLAAGLYLSSMVSASFYSSVVAFLLMGVAKGGFHLLFLGKPLRCWRMFSRPQTSWISRGLYLVFFFFFFAGGYLALAVFAPGSALEPLLKYGGALAAIGVATYSGFTLSSVAAVPFWNSGMLPVLFLTSAISSGAALDGLISNRFGGADLHNAGNPLLVFMLPLALTFLIVCYMWNAKYSDPTARYSARQLLSGQLSWLFWSAVLLIVVVSPFSALLYRMEGWGTVAGLEWLHVCSEVLGAGIIIKYAILRAGYYRPLSPVSGVG